MLDVSLSPETRALADALRAVPFGATITYGELSAAVGFDVQTRRHLVASALRIALRDDGAAFEGVRKVGYRRLRPEEAPEVGKGARRGIARKAATGLARMRALARSSNGLDDNVQRRLSAEVAVLGVIAEAARERNLPAPPADAPPPTVAETARDFLRRLAGREGTEE